MQTKVLVYCAQQIEEEGTTVLSVEEWKALVLQKVGQYRVRDDVFMRRVFKDDTHSHSSWLTGHIGAMTSWVT
jgi:hypothetical protein